MPTLLSRSSDPFDGRAARRARMMSSVLRLIFALTSVVLVALVAVNLPPIDPSVVTKPEARPFIGGALLAVLGTAILIALLRIRRADRT